MPFIHISLRAGKPEAFRQTIFDSLYRAMREALSVPEGDQFMTISERRASLCTTARRTRRAGTRRLSNATPARRRIMRPCLVPTGSGVSVMSSGGPVIDPRPAADLQMASPADRSIPPVGTLLPERRRNMNAIHQISAGERYARCIQTSKRVRWDVDEDMKLALDDVVIGKQVGRRP